MRRIGENTTDCKARIGLAGMSLANMLSELRKYQVNLVLTHQYLSQLDEDVRDAILGNAATNLKLMIDGRVSKPFSAETIVLA